VHFPPPENKSGEQKAMRKLLANARVCDQNMKKLKFS
jgi:hypothetical protein